MNKQTKIKSLVKSLQVKDSQIKKSIVVLLMNVELKHFIHFARAQPTMLLMNCSSAEDSLQKLST